MKTLQLLDDIINEFDQLEDIIISLDRIKEIRDTLISEAAGWVSQVPAGMCKIFGSEITFEILIEEDQVVKKCKDIWNNPQNYSNYKQGSDLSFLGFLKFLWVKYPNGSEKRLSEIAVER